MNWNQRIFVAAFAALAAASTTHVATAADNGAQLFHQYCSICHDTTPGKNKVGPSLAGVFGRKAGTEAGFSYSPGMQHSGLTWDEQTLDKYLTNPRAVVPGNKMPFLGVKDPNQRHAIIAYLKTLKP
ncbi:MAG TPA: cytochrome c family protein [Stellaceae bacterium]|nr:cytochrome c family protein [Stellaceae bacterium]